MLRKKYFFLLKKKKHGSGATELIQVCRKLGALSPRGRMKTTIVKQHKDRQHSSRKLLELWELKNPKCLPPKLKFTKPQTKEMFTPEIF